MSFHAKSNSVRNLPQKDADRKIQNSVEIPHQIMARPIALAKNNALPVCELKGGEAW